MNFINAVVIGNNAAAQGRLIALHGDIDVFIIAGEVEFIFAALSHIEDNGRAVAHDNSIIAGAASDCNFSYFAIDNSQVAVVAESDSLITFCVVWNVSSIAAVFEATEVSGIAVCVGEFFISSVFRAIGTEFLSDTFNIVVIFIGYRRRR